MLGLPQGRGGGECLSVTDLTLTRFAITLPIITLLPLTFPTVRLTPRRFLQYSGRLSVLLRPKRENVLLVDRIEQLSRRVLLPQRSGTAFVGGGGQSREGRVARGDFAVGRDIAQSFLLVLCTETVGVRLEGSPWLLGKVQKRRTHVAAPLPSPLPTLFAYAPAHSPDIATSLRVSIVRRLPTPAPTLKLLNHRHQFPNLPLHSRLPLDQLHKGLYRSHHTLRISSRGSPLGNFWS